MVAVVRLVASTTCTAAATVMGGVELKVVVDGCKLLVGNSGFVFLVLLYKINVLFSAPSSLTQTHSHPITHT